MAISMRPEGDDPRRDEAEMAERLARILLTVAGDQSVRVIEAVAAALANRQTQTLEGPGYGFAGLAEPGEGYDPERWDAPGDRGPKQALCRRVARRAVRSSLADPTRGATAFHRVEETPVWACDLLPVAAFGPFLFYRRQPPQDMVEPRPGNGSGWDAT